MDVGRILRERDHKAGQSQRRKQKDISLSRQFDLVANADMSLSLFKSKTTRKRKLEQDFAQYKDLSKKFVVIGKLQKDMTFMPCKADILREHRSYHGERGPFEKELSIKKECSSETLRMRSEIPQERREA
ncbi:hypothetical protein Tco_0883255 [Tanacetum coccineum]